MWTKEDRIRQIKLEETIRVYEDDDLLVVIPKTIHSMCLYGKGTTWCFASEDERQMVLDGRMASLGCQSTFDDYYDSDVIYVFIMKKEFDFMHRNKKYCMQFERGEFHDAKGSDKDFAKFLERFPKLKELLKIHITSGVYRKYPYPYIHLDYMNGNRYDKEKYIKKYNINI